MSETIESVVLESSTETPAPKKPRLTRRAKIAIAAGAATAVAAVAVVLQVRSGDDETSEEQILDETYTTYETLSDLESVPTE